MKPFMWGGKGIMSCAVQQYLQYLCAVWVWQAVQICGMISKESHGHHSLRFSLLSCRGALRWCVWVIDRQSSVLYKCKKKTQTNKWQKRSLEESGRAVSASICVFSTFADLSLEPYAVKDTQSAEVQGTTLILKTLWCFSFISTKSLRWI